jgi:hypothetical protein
VGQTRKNANYLEFLTHYFLMAVPSFDDRHLIIQRRMAHSFMAHPFMTHPFMAHPSMAHPFWPA